jgi:hypothetical protein
MPEIRACAMPPIAAGRQRLAPSRQELATAPGVLYHQRADGRLECVACAHRYHVLPGALALTVGKSRTAARAGRRHVPCADRAREIEVERYALKALRGDFRAVPAETEEVTSERVAAALEAASTKRSS